MGVAIVMAGVAVVWCLVFPDHPMRPFGIVVVVVFIDKLCVRVAETNLKSKIDRSRITL